MCSKIVKYSNFIPKSQKLSHITFCSRSNHLLVPKSKTSFTNLELLKLKTFKHQLDNIFVTFIILVPFQGKHTGQ